MMNHDDELLRRAPYNPNRQLKFIPSKRAANEEKKLRAEARKIDKGFDFGPTKLRALAKCSCGAVRGVYSVYKVGNTGGPTAADLARLEQWLENTGYVCGCKIEGGGLLYSKRDLGCGNPNPIEANYYNPSTGTKGGRIVTKDICSVCYIEDENCSQQFQLLKKT